MNKYFELDPIAVLDKPVALAKLVDKPTSEGIKALQVQIACLDRNQRQHNMYYKKYNIH